MSKLAHSVNPYLTIKNKRLQELRKQYAAFDSLVTEPLVWVDGHVTPTGMVDFRGETYVWQVKGGYDERHYATTARYVTAIDTLQFLDILTEDGSFGVHTFSIDGRKVSRDLLDSIVELYFLERHLNISTASNIRILDIGAGYGRLAHRVVTGLSNVHRYFCTDAVAVSTFICEHYLRQRQITNKARVIPLHKLSVLKKETIQIAINVHSFSECTISAIEWWTHFMEQNKIQYLMVVPNPLQHGGTQLLTNLGYDFLPIIHRAGYDLVAKDPKYLDPIVQQKGIYPTYHYLFQLK